MRKEWGQLGYEVNGLRIQFPIYFYLASFGVALFCLVWAVVQWHAAASREE